MEKFISKEKLSKREQRRRNQAQRTLWDINPVTRVKGSAKAYSRARSKVETRRRVEEG